VRAYGEVVANFKLGMSERDMGSMIRHAILKYTEDCAPPIATRHPHDGLSCRTHLRSMMR